MEYESIELEEFSIIAISTRTINWGSQSLKDMGELWNNFLNNNLIEKIPNKISNDIYCLYTDYESDYKGYYTAILGCKVSSLESIPDGFIGKQFPKLKYQKIISQGKIPESIFKTWQNIWQSDIKRAYKADFEVYGKESQDMSNAIVEIYLSVKD
jgi:predicted transcriptional regulator YdeE